jgi:hypothetical protein
MLSMLQRENEIDPDKLNQKQIDEMREKRLKEKKAKKAIREILIYSCFIWV